MGFSRENAEIALENNGNDFDKALDVLLMEQSKEETKKDDKKVAVSQQTQTPKPSSAKADEIVSTIHIDEQINLSSEISELVCNGYKLLTEDILFGKYALDEGS